MTTEKSATNVWYFDRYSFAHFAVGALFEASRIPAPVAIGSHIVFEAAEDGIKRGVERIWPDASPDTLMNHVGDVVSFTAGFYATRYLKHSNAGMAFISGFVAAAAGIWMWNLMHGHSWLKTDPER